MVNRMEKVNEVKESVKIDGLCVDDWVLTMKELKSTLQGIKVQRKVLESGIVQCELEIAKFNPEF